LLHNSAIRSVENEAERVHDEQTFLLQHRLEWSMLTAAAQVAVGECQPVLQANVVLPGGLPTSSSAHDDGAGMTKYW
jgi:hypothetical protein